MAEEEGCLESGQDGVPAQKGGLRTMPFIIANEALQSIAIVGLAPNMILYLLNSYNLDMPTAMVLLSIYGSTSDFLSILGAVVSDSYLGRFRVIALGSLASVLGMLVLWLTTMIPQVRPSPCTTGCQGPTFLQLAFLASSFVFMSIGSGCIKPCSMAFGADQLVNEKNGRVVESFYTLYYASGALSSVIALTVIVYIQDHFGYKVGFGVPAALMLLSAVSFFVASPLYVNVKASTSLFTGLIQVPVAVFKKRHQEFPPAGGVYYCRKEDSDATTPSDKLQFLNKACIIRNPEKDLKYDGSAANSWELCTVHQVETLKVMINIIPIWSTGIVIYTILSQSFAVVQATSMDRHIWSNFEIPAGSFTLFTPLSIAIWMTLYDRVIIPLVAKCAGQQYSMSPKLRMGLGLILATLAMAVAAVVETIRRRTAIKEGLVDDPTGIVSMSAMWLIPQYCLTGLAVGFNGVGQIEYYFSKLPQSMSSIAYAIYTLGTAFSGLLSSLITTVVNDLTSRGGKVSWLSTSLNKAHYDYQYLLISFLCFLNFLYFLVCSGAYSSEPDARITISKEKDELTTSLLAETGEARALASSSA